MHANLNVESPHAKSLGTHTSLQLQLSAFGGTTAAFVASDDATVDPEIIKVNEAINQLPGCRYILKSENTGSAANRNYLGAISRYPLLLFLDCDISISHTNFLQRYLSTPIDGVVNGGISIIDDMQLHQNLRYRYEKAEIPAHTAVMRQANRYQHFRSTNFMITRSAFGKCPFDERFRRSGYEDVLYGKMLKQQHINVVHIDNPVLMTKFENNPDYVTKIERSLQTLYTFRNELKGYSRLLTFVSGIHLSTTLQKSRETEPLRIPSLSMGFQTLPLRLLSLYSIKADFLAKHLEDIYLFYIFAAILLIN